MSSWLTADEQIKRVAERFPNLRLVLNYKWLVMWEGPLVGFSRRYEVRIFWHRWWPGDLFEVPYPHDKPKVLVLEPPLQAREDLPLDHVYRRTHPVWICPFDPKGSRTSLQAISRSSTRWQRSHRIKPASSIHFRTTPRHP